MHETRVTGNSKALSNLVRFASTFDFSSAKASQLAFNIFMILQSIDIISG